MLRRKDDEIPRREVSLWLEKMGIPQEHYRYLPPSYKILLRDLVCARTDPPSEWKLQDLYRKLHSSKTRTGQNATDTVPVMTKEELHKFFSPLPPSETLSDWEKY